MKQLRKGIFESLNFKCASSAACWKALRKSSYAEDNQVEKVTTPAHIYANAEPRTIFFELRFTNTGASRRGETN